MTELMDLLNDLRIKRELAKLTHDQALRLDRDSIEAARIDAEAQQALVQARTALELFRRRQVADELKGEYKTGAWEKHELAAILLSNKPPHRIAIVLQRRLEDVERAAKTITEAWNSMPEATANMLSITIKQFNERRGRHDDSAEQVCLECFTTPHQITCSHAS